MTHRMSTFSKPAPDFTNPAALSHVCNGKSEKGTLPNPCFKWNFYLFYKWGLLKREYMKTIQLIISFHLKIEWSCCSGQSRLLSEDCLLCTKAYLPGKYNIYSPNLGGWPLSELPSSHAVQAMLKGSQDSFYHATFFSHEIDVTPISLALFLLFYLQGKNSIYT